MVKIQVTRDLSVLKVSGRYPEDVSEGYKVLGQVPMTRPGSVWGLDGVAEHVASTHGSFTLNKSGISKRMAKALVKAGKAEYAY